MLPLDLKAFADAAGWSQLSKPLVELNIQSTATDLEFPGAILPVVASSGHTYFYAAVSTAVEWRQLRPLLMAFVGPTITQFSGMRRAPRPDRPAEELLLRAGAVSLAPLVPPTEGVELASRALSRLVQSVRGAPKVAVRPPASTGTLLSQFDMCIAAGDRNGAESLLATLEQEWRLDPINLRFAEVRLLAAFDDWNHLLQRPWFDDLCRVPKPRVITNALLEGLWRVRLAPHSEDKVELRKHYRTDIRLLCVDLLDEVPEAREGGAVSIAALEGEVFAPTEPLEIPSSRSEGWLEWILSVPHRTRQGLAESAREAALQQPISSLLSTEDAKQIADALQSLVNIDERDALLAALPVAVTWLKGDPNFPRVQLLPLYDATVTLFAYLEDRGHAARDALLLMLDAALSVGTTADGYRRILQDAAEFVDKEAGLATIYWLLELAETLIRHPSQDPDERHRLLNFILSSMRGVLPHLTGGQRLAYSRIAFSEGWDALPPVFDASIAVSPAASFAGKSVAIYSLTESAARQAEEALTNLVPGIRVELAADHVCSPRLQALSKNVDVFVVVTSSAKHAATECIQSHRPSGAPILYAAGKGVSSILRAIEEYAAR